MGMGDGVAMCGMALAGMLTTAGSMAVRGSAEMVCSLAVGASLVLELKTTMAPKC